RVCVPSDALVAATPDQAGSIYGDKMHPAVYDTSKIRDLVPGWEARIPFAEGIRECIAWFEADPARQSVDARANAMFDRLARIYRRALDEAGQ
ncbi:MAG: NAD-dependent dehydratase, partial [Demequina sp.]